MPVYRLDERLLFPPPGARTATRAHRRGRRPAPGAPAPRLLDGHLPLAGRAPPLALARPAHGPPRGRARGLAQPPPDDPARRLPRHPRHRLHRGHDRLRHHAAPGPGRHVDHARRWSSPTPSSTGAGIAHSVEAWRGDTLVGGLYGLSLGRGLLRRVHVRPRDERLEGGLRRPRRAATALGDPARGLPGLHRRTSRASGRGSGRGATSSPRSARLSTGPPASGPGGSTTPAPVRPDARAARSCSSTASKSAGSGLSITRGSPVRG